MHGRREQLSGSQPSTHPIPNLLRSQQPSSSSPTSEDEQVVELQFFVSQATFILAIFSLRSWCSTFHPLRHGSALSTVIHLAVKLLTNPCFDAKQFIPASGEPFSMNISAMVLHSEAFVMSMASIGTTRVLHLRRPWPVRKEEPPAAVASAICWARKGKLREVLVRAGGGNGSNQASVDRVNGRKVNGVMHGSEASLSTRNGSAVRRIDDGGAVSMHAYRLGRFVEDRFVYRQTFVIRSYEIGPDETATMETLLNLLQETALNHVMSSGLASDGFGATHQMSLRKLIWVVTRINIQVEKYSRWGDVVEIDTWVAASGKNGMRRDWMIRDCSTRNIITRATSNWVMMNRETRKLSKLPEQVREEVKPFYLERRVFFDGSCDNEKIEKLTEDTAENIKSGLAPRWSDMDVNQHVNNVKYIGWIMESVPMNVLEDYRLTSMTLEYRRECRQSNLLESLTSLNEGEESPVNTSSYSVELQSTHLLRLQEDKAEIIRGRAEWKRK